MPTPIVLVRTVSHHGFDWVAALSGAAAVTACVMLAVAARVVRTRKLVVGRL
jgi:hypothetical protein